MKKEEVNYKVKFIEKYLTKKLKTQIEIGYDVLNKVDICLSDLINNKPILYIESKDSINNDGERRKALAQTILTNHKQKLRLNKCVLIYKDKENNDILEFLDCSDDNILYNNDINWDSEKASSPSFDAINRINDRLIGKITTYNNEEISVFFDNLIQNKDIQINITIDNVRIIYNDWQNNISFKKKIEDEQEKINLFLTDILNGTKYQKKVENELMGQKQINLLPIIREGTNLNEYELEDNVNRVEIRYKNSSVYYEIENLDKYRAFWRKYKRPPFEEEFLNIIERSATLYTDEYRRTTGAEYTPSCFVELQNKLIEEYYGENWKNEYIVFDPCAGVGNLQNDFGKEYKKSFCYLSTLETHDVDTCKIKGFENVKQYDYLKDDKHPTFKYCGEEMIINEICKLENKKLMVIMNPPYDLDGKINKAIKFFNKVLELEPQTIVFYYHTESFLNNEIEYYLKSKYKIVKHIFSDAKKTFKLSNWAISLVIFDKDKGEYIDKSRINTDRYEVNYGKTTKKEKDDKLYFVKSYTYNQSKVNLIKELEKKVKENATGFELGFYCYLSNVFTIGNDREKKSAKITTNNLEYCLLSKGISFNSHAKYFERNGYCYRCDNGIEDILKINELYNDSIMFSLFYNKNLFSNKNNLKNYIMPFTSEELGCNKNDLNILLLDDINNNGNNLLITNERFDFREWFHKFKFSKEAIELYMSALQIFKYYHKNYKDTNFNDSFYDITNIIMKKDPTQFKELELEEDEEDTRISQTKTTKGTVGFGRSALLKKNNEYIPNEAIPIFKTFFDKRDILAIKINKQLVESGLLLWERENIY